MSERLAKLAEAASAVNGDAGRALHVARGLGGWAPKPGTEHTRELFEILATLAVSDLTAARVAEAHLDALSILDQAHTDAGPVDAHAGPIDSHAGPVDAHAGPVEADDARTWGVFAAEGPGVRVDASGHGTRWRLNGTKPWCSLAGSLSHALITAHTADGHRRLFAVALADPNVTVHAGAWVAKGLPNVPSGPVDFTDVAATPIGADEWYLQRPGFAWGGIGVAACWWGGAVGIARALYSAAQTREPDQIALAHLGAVDVLLTAAGGALADAADAIDTGAATGSDGQLLAARVRGLVARTVDEVIVRVGHALGPAPLALDERHSRRVADLQLYIRQHHAERDDAALGRLLMDAGQLPW